MIKFFFMAQMRATLEGRPQYEFNSVTALPQRNVLAADLTKIQQAAANMLNGQVQFDDIVITNLFFLAECTEEQFFANMQQQNVATQAEAPAGLEDAVAESLDEAKAEVQSDRDIDQKADAEELGAEKADLSPEGEEVEPTKSAD